jgi:hypothetical protein
VLALVMLVLVILVILHDGLCSGAHGFKERRQRGN